MPGQVLTEFEKAVLDKLKKVPRGRISTYSLLARAAGRPRAARAVGNALNKNPCAPQVPCHRVVKSDGQVGGYAGGSGQKAAWLRKEGLKIKNGRIIDYEKKLYRF